MDWPELPYEAWHETKDTLHMVIQIAGKVRAALAPVEEDWGHAPLYVTARGVNTSPIPHPNGVFEIDVDFIDHVLRCGRRMGGSTASGSSRGRYDSTPS